VIERNIKYNNIAIIFVFKRRNYIRLRY